MRKAKEHAGAAALRHMWLLLTREPWDSLAIVPVDPGISSREVATAFDELVRFFDLGAFKFVDAEGASLPSASRAAESLVAGADRTVRTVFCVSSPLHHAGAVPLVMAADLALLVVRVGETRLDAARQVIEIVGRERVAGCVAFHGAAGGAPARPEGGGTMQELR